MDDRRISLKDRLQRKWFTQALSVLSANRNQLSEYDRELWRKLQDGWDMFKESMTVTRKQFNHIRQVASELVSEGYRG